MTKIAISPNANGTGTFTIAAPDSNTDRTLTLPDAGGEVFSQGNIVGTVSQSAGIPTGGIIQRSSNSNGEFVRFADGTQICRGNLPSVASNISTGNMFRSDNSDVTLPASFQDSNFSVALRSNSVIGWANAQGTTTATFTFRRFSSTSSGTSSGVYLAIGRWF